MKEWSGDEDLSRLGVKGWWMVARDQESWRRILREPSLKKICV